MRFRFRQVCLAAVVCVVLPGVAFAQGDATTPDSTTPPATTSEPAPGADTPDKVEYGVGIRLRYVTIPRGELELFMEHAAGGTGNFGFGADFVRRRDNFEIVIGFEYEKITLSEGVYIEPGDDVAQGDPADFILGDSSLGWFTLDVTFVNHSPINDKLAVRYGAGFGLGLVTGELKRIDVLCNGATNSRPEPGCVPPPDGNATPTPDDGVGTPGAAAKYDLPPVFPVINAIIGLQFRPTPKATINVETGIRTLLFFGISGSYFF